MMTADKLSDILKKAGFSRREISSLTKPTKNQFSQEKQDLNELWKTGLIQKAIKSRVKYIHQCKDAGWSSKEIQSSILAIDRNLEAEGNGIFSFLRLEYSIKTDTGGFSYKVAVRNRTRSIINQTASQLGVRYGKRGYQYRRPNVPHKVTVRPVNQPPLPL